MRQRALLCAVAFILGPAPATAADDASAWLLQVSDAARLGSYQGIVVYRDGQHMEVMRLVHRQRDGRMQERITSLTGRPRDIVRQDDRVAYVVGDGPAESSGPQSLFPVVSRELLTEAATHYEYRDLGHARVAGRPCRGVLMSPRDDYRYGYEICGDEATGVPLRVTLLDRRGRMVEQLMFTEISYPTSIPDAAFALPPGAATPAVAAAPADAEPAADTTDKAGPDKAGWDLASLPPGFHVVLRKRSLSPDGQGIVEHVLLSDGVSAVSVFGVRQLVEVKALRGVSQMGAMNVYGRRVGEFQVTVVGEVPASTVRMIGDGLVTGSAPATPAAPAAAAAATTAGEAKPD